LLICSKNFAKQNRLSTEQAELWIGWILLQAECYLVCRKKSSMQYRFCAISCVWTKMMCWCQVVGAVFWLFSWICYALYKKSQIIFGISSVCCFARVLKLKLNTDWNDERREEEEETGQRKKHKVTNHEQRNIDLSENFKNFYLILRMDFWEIKSKEVSVCVTGAINYFFFKFRGILVGHYRKGYYFCRVVAIPFYTIVFCR